MICEHCHSGDPAISHCSNCCVYMCEFCVTAHKRIIGTKDHKILSLEEVRRLGTKIPKKPATCGKHIGETLKLFCKTCQRIICRDCTIVDHREHNYIFAAEVAAKEREILRGVLQETKRQECVVEEGLKVVQAMENRVHDKAATVNEDVDAFFDRQVKELEHLRADLKREVSMQEQGKCTQLRRQREKLLFFLVRLKCGIKFCDQAMADGDDVALLSVKNQIVQRLSKLNAEQYDCQPCQDDFLKLGVCKRIADIGKMAVISCVPMDPEKCVLSMVGGEKGVLYETLAGQTVDFLLTLNQACTAYSYAVSAIVKYKPHGQIKTREENLEVHENGGGLYSFSFLPKDVGQVMLSVKVEGQDIHGSPFIWQAKDKCSNFTVKGTKKMKMASSSARQDGTVVKEGMQCWKLKLVSYSTPSALEIGVQTTGLGHKGFGGVSFSSGKRDQKWSWQYDPSRLHHGHSSHSDPKKLSVIPVKDNDVFTVFLNPETSTLIVYNACSKQSETITGVVGEVVPFYTPSLRRNTGIVFGKTGYLTLDV